MKNVVPILCIFFLQLLLSCAIPMAPTGGPKDEKPPKLGSVSPPNQSKNVYPKKIVLSFDEKIGLGDMQEISIIPKIHPEVEKTVSGKNLILSFKVGKDSLDFLKNTTYRLSLGKGVKDITEGNVSAIPDFIFSTGSVLDSLIISGYVLDAFTLKPVPEALVRLDVGNNDSDLYKKPSRFFGYSDFNGRFEIRNLKDSVYRFIAYSDKNKDYLLQSDEQVSIIKSLKATNKPLDDTVFISKPLDLNPPDSIKRLGDLTSIKLNLGYSFSGFSRIPDVEFDYDAILSDSIVISNGFVTDVDVRIKYRYLNDTGSYPIGKILKAKQNDTSVVLEVIDENQLSLSYRVGKFKSKYVELDSLNFKGIRLITLPDSIPTKIADITIKDKNELLIDYKFIDDPEINGLLLNVPRGTIKYTTSNKVLEDSKISIPYLSEDNYGKVTLRIKNPLNKRVIIKAVNSEGKELYSGKNKKSEEIILKRLEKSQVEIYYFEDMYTSGVWTPIQFTKKIPAMRIIRIPERINVRPNWEEVKEIEIR